MKRASGTLLKVARGLGRGGSSVARAAAEIQSAAPSRSINHATLPFASRGFAATAVPAEAEVQVVVLRTGLVLLLQLLSCKP